MADTDDTGATEHISLGWLAAVGVAIVVALVAAALVVGLTDNEARAPQDAPESSIAVLDSAPTPRG